MNMKDIKFQIEFSPENEAWICRTSNLGGKVIAGHGDSPSEAAQECAVATSIVLSIV